VDRPARPDDGSPTRLIAIMVGIVGILLLGSLAWSAVGALFSALGQATAVLAPARATPISLVAIAATAIQSSPPTTQPTPVATSGATPMLTSLPTVGPTPAVTPSPAAAGRAPWILLPQPAPGARVASGPMVIEARGRGDAAISAIRLELDGASLPVSLEQRSESTWRGVATARISAGQHNVRATVVDEQGRSGGYRWTFDAGP
jgi:hypothetical protein